MSPLENLGLRIAQYIIDQKVILDGFSFEPFEPDQLELMAQEYLETYEKIEKDTNN
jgi:hypothetical protein